MNTDYINGSVMTDAGMVPAISTSWSVSDILNTIRVRWAIGRMDYRITPGIYAAGNPGKQSRVFVTCNFKLTFDHVRRALHGMDAWLLALDTRGINVWCAAGKGTFSTTELVRQIQLTSLDKLVNHRKVIVPQLGATGISAHEVRKQSGFSVIYGPVRVADLAVFIRNGLKASREMRTVKFPLWERMKLIPVELSYGKYYLLLVPAFFILVSGLNPDGYSVDRAAVDGTRAILNLLAAYLSGLAVTPLLLPWIPFRRFSLKGLFIGLLAAVILFALDLSGDNALEQVSWFLMIGGLSSFLAMNFTGSSTFTSLSGVKKEMKTAVPVQISLTASGLIIWIISKFLTL